MIYKANFNPIMRKSQRGEGVQLQADAHNAVPAGDHVHANVGRVNHDKVVLSAFPGGQFNSFVEISTDFSTEFL